MSHGLPSRFLREFRWYRRSRLWVVPSAGVATALLLATASLSFDYFLIDDGAPFPVFSGAPSTARSILSLIGTAIATLTALVLTIVAVIIQLATQALSPRAVRTFLQDAHSHVTIGTFVTTFTYALVVLQQFELTYSADAARINSISVTIAFVLAVFSLGIFISYVDHIVHQSRVTSIIDRIGNETRRAIDEQYPPAEAEGRDEVTGTIPDRDPDHIVRSPRHGVILEIDVGTLVGEIARSDAVVTMVPSVGDFIPSGGRLLEVYGDPGDPGVLSATVDVDAERSITQDVPFGFRLLIDIAERSLSTGINDPTTATQVVDQVHDLLLRLGSRPFPNGWHADDDGIPRLFVPQPTWNLYVALAFEEIRHHGSGSMQVVRRVRSVVTDLLDELPADRHPPLKRQLRILDDIAERTFPTDAEREAARHADAQGIGSGTGFDPSDSDGQGRTQAQTADEGR